MENFNCSTNVAYSAIGYHLITEIGNNYHRSDKILIHPIQLLCESGDVVKG